MSNDYSKHRLNSDLDLKPYYNMQIAVKGGIVTFWEYAELVYSRIVLMAPGECIRVDNMTGETNRDLFIKTICAFILNGVAQDFYFNSTYTVFCRNKALIKQSKERQLKKNQI